MINSYASFATLITIYFPAGEIQIRSHGEKKLPVIEISYSPKTFDVLSGLDSGTF